jgi:hypothetical protein
METNTRALRSGRFFGHRYGIKVQSGLKDGAPSPSSTADRAIYRPILAPPNVT